MKWFKMDHNYANANAFFSFAKKSYPGYVLSFLKIQWFSMLRFLNPR